MTTYTAKCLECDTEMAFASPAERRAGAEAHAWDAHECDAPYMTIVNGGRVDRDDAFDPDEVRYQFNCLLGRYRAALDVDPQELMEALCNNQGCISELRRPGSTGRTAQVFM